MTPEAITVAIKVDADVTAVNAALAAYAEAMKGLGDAMFAAAADVEKVMAEFAHQTDQPEGA